MISTFQDSLYRLSSLVGFHLLGANFLGVGAIQPKNRAYARAAILA